jgi:hypothetical protein
MPVTEPVYSWPQAIAEHDKGNSRRAKVCHAHRLLTFIPSLSHAASNTLAPNLDFIVTSQIEAVNLQCTNFCNLWLAVYPGVRWRAVTPIFWEKEAADPGFPSNVELSS